MAVILEAKDIAQKITIEIRIKRLDQWRWRTALGLWLMRLAAWVMWVNIEVIE